MAVGDLLASAVCAALSLTWRVFGVLVVMVMVMVPLITMRNPVATPSLEGWYFSGDRLWMWKKV